MCTKEARVSKTPKMQDLLEHDNLVIADENPLTLEDFAAQLETVRQQIGALQYDVGNSNFGSKIYQTKQTLVSKSRVYVGAKNDAVILDAKDDTYRIWAGNEDPASASFKVTKAGVMIATGATISGNITASSGTIGGWSIGSNTLSGGGVVLDSGAGSITGGTIQTASSGQRVVMNGTYNRLDFYDSSSRVASVLGSSGAMLFSIITNTLLLNDTQFFPYNSMDLGWVLGPWNDLYLNGSIQSVQDINANGDIATGGLITTGNYVNAGSGFQIALSTVIDSGRNASFASISSGGNIGFSGNGFLNLKSMTGATASGLSAQNGSMYYRSDTNEVRVMVSGAFKTVTVT